jgi:hypothetical protein
MKKRSISSKIFTYLFRVKDPVVMIYKRLALLSFVSFLSVSIFDLLVSFKIIDISFTLIDIPIWKELLTFACSFIFLYLLHNRVKLLDLRVDAVLIHQFTMPGFNVASFEKLYQLDFNPQRIRKISMDNDLTVNGVFDGSGHKYVRDIISLNSRLKDDELANKIFANMSERATELLKEELQYMGMVKLKDVEAAQARIIDVVKQLEESGDISLNIRGGTEEVYV